MIGRHKYNNLKSKSKEELSIEELCLIEWYENENNRTNSQVDKESIREYWEKTLEDKKQTNFTSTKSLLNYTLKIWIKQNSRKMILDEETRSFMYTLAYYFLGDENFYKSPLIFKGKNNNLIPSLDKGLLIVGNYGCGKTSIVSAFRAASQNQPFEFSRIFARFLVTRYETLTEPDCKKRYWDDYKKGIKCFDDVLSEELANNYGKVDIIKTILLYRYESKSKTHAIINYDDSFPNDTSKALEQIYTKYGSRLYDRCFDMFNIIELKNPSKRC